MVLSMNKFSDNKITCLFLIILTSSGFCDPETTARSAHTSTKKVSLLTTQPATLSTATNVQTTVCKENSSCNTNSTLFPTTTSLPTTTLENKNKSSPGLGGDATPAKKQKAQSLEEICICNLKVEYCDINCCCDSDCSFENKLAFGHCEPDFHHYDTRFCQYMKHRYINKTSSKVQVNQEGLFCVMPNNVPQSYLIQKKTPLKTFAEATFQKGNKYSWPDFVSKSTVSQSELNNYYSYGKMVWLLQNNVLNTLEYFKSFVVSNCLVKEEIKFLVDVKSTCSHTDISEANLYLNSDSYFKNSSIIANPILLNSSQIAKNTVVQKCPAGACIKINPKVCDMYFENCIEYNKFKIDFGLKCGMQSTSKILFCLNLVKHVKYNFYHNGTNGIQRADVLLHLVNETFPDDGIEFPQTFEVNFIWWNHVLNYSSLRSGNPGYLVGKPILSAHIVSINKTVSDNPNSKNVSRHFYENRIFRDPQDYTSNFLVLPHVDENGKCELNKHQYTTVEFGINIYQKCRVSEYTSVKNNTARSICVDIQKKIFHYWSLNVTNDTLANKMVGQFGNANIFKLDDWVQVLFQEDLGISFNMTNGIFNNKTSLTCINITTLLSVEIFHARIDFDDVINQEKILGVTYTFGNVQNFTFPLQVAESNSLNFRIQIITKVAFFDITTKKTRKIVDPPTLNIRLPHDFFYPFVKLDNAGCISSLSHILYSLTICMSILYYFK